MTVFIAGIDPGIKHNGVAIIRMPDRKVVFAATNPEDVADIMRFWNPIVIGIEEPFAGRNIKAYGDTKEIIGMILYKLGDTFRIVRTSPAAGNSILGLEKGSSKTDAAKRRAAENMFGRPFDDGHQVSAIAAAFVAWDIFRKEILNV